jgi:hypothetical protein
VIDTLSYGANRVIAEDIYSKSDAELLAARLNTASGIGIEQGIKLGKAEEQAKPKSVSVDERIVEGLNI